MDFLMTKRSGQHMKNGSICVVQDGDSVISDSDLSGLFKRSDRNKNNVWKIRQRKLASTIIKDGVNDSRVIELVQQLIWKTK